MSDNPGIMGEAYFVGKRQLLEWVNDFLGLNYTKVEQMASGAAHCQILDAIFPGKVPLSKVHFDAKYDYDFVKNYKVLQGVFDKMNVDKRVPVQRLIKAKYQDNLEFFQWMKNFFDVRYSGDEYDAVGRRNAALRKQGKKVPKSSKASSRAEGKTGSSASRKPAKSSTGTRTRTNSGPRSSGDAEKRLRAKDKEIGELTTHVEEMKGHIELLEKERTFYYTKLRNIEILLQDIEEDNDLKKSVLDILYQTDEGFEAPEEGEEPEEA
mmetsp:Transcript_17367/g.32961  ORF Transcript_17367/g.32961 Transcript_17367/m.32961 type:complete len:266 (-) Transcript_17367:161-958(-)